MGRIRAGGGGFLALLMALFSLSTGNGTALCAGLPSQGPTLGGPGRGGGGPGLLVLRLRGRGEGFSSEDGEGLSIKCGAGKTLLPSVEGAGGALVEGRRATVKQVKGVVAACGGTSVSPAPYRISNAPAGMGKVPSRAGREAYRQLEAGARREPRPPLPPPPPPQMGAGHAAAGAWGMSSAAAGGGASGRPTAGQGNSVVSGSRGDPPPDRQEEQGQGERGPQRGPQRGRERGFQRTQERPWMKQMEDSVEEKQRSIRGARDREGQCQREHADVVAAAAKADAAAAAKEDAAPRGEGAGKRFWYNKKEKQWVIARRKDEDLSVESLNGYWIFSKDDCLTYRWRVPNRWGVERLTWLELFAYLTPVVNILFKIFRGFWPCAVCGRWRSEHMFWHPMQTNAAFFDAYQDRDIAMCVRLVKGGADCNPGSAMWCTLVFIMANYCKDPFKEVNEQFPEVHFNDDHLREPTEEIDMGLWIETPYL